MKVNAIKSTTPTYTGNIIIDGKQNKHVKYLYNHAINIVREAKCGAVFETGEDKITMSPATVKATNIIKGALNKLKVVWLEK